MWMNFLTFTAACFDDAFIITRLHAMRKHQAVFQLRARVRVRAWVRESGEALGPWGLHCIGQLLLLKAVYQESWAPDKNKGWDSSWRSSVSDAHSAQALRPFCTCFQFLVACLCEFGEKAHPRTMLSVNSARQLCTLFVSLHAVLLSVAIVESSASNGNQKGNMIHQELFFIIIVKPLHDVYWFSSN